MSYSYDQATSTVNTTYTFTTTAREGTETSTVVALYPHQWTHLTGGHPDHPDLRLAARRDEDADRRRRRFTHQR